MVTRIGVAVNVTVAVGVAVSVGSVTTGGGALHRPNMTTARAMTAARMMRLRITDDQLIAVIVTRISHRRDIASRHNSADHR